VSGDPRENGGSGGLIGDLAGFRDLEDVLVDEISDGFFDDLIGEGAIEEALDRGCEGPPLARTGRARFVQVFQKEFKAFLGGHEGRHLAEGIAPCGENPQVFQMFDDDIVTLVPGDDVEIALRVSGGPHADLAGQYEIE